MKKMKFLSKGKVITGAVVVVLAAVIIGKMTKKETVEVEDLRPTVKIENPTNGNITLYTDVIGTIEPAETVTVFPKMGGELLEVNFEVGQSIEAGAQLAKIDSDALTALKIQVDGAKVSMDDAQRALERTQALFNGGTVSQQQLEQAQSGATGARLQYEAAKNSYDLQMKYTTITAPISGVIQSKNVDVHDMIGNSSPVCVISAMNQNNVVFAVSEKVMKNLTPGLEIEIDKNGTKYSGNITEVSSMVDAASGLYKVKAAIAGGEALTNGSKVKLSVLMDQAENVMIVPVDAVSFANGSAFLYVYEDGKAVKKDVEIGIFDTDNIQITEGLSAADEVIYTWSNELHDGAEVKLKDETPVATENTETTAATVK